MAQLGSALPGFIRTDNPLDLRDDATPQRYLAAIKGICLTVMTNDALLLVHAPSTAARGGTTAEYLIEALCASIHEANALRYSPTGVVVNTLHSKHGGYLAKQAFQLTAHQKGQ